MGIFFIVKGLVIKPWSVERIYREWCMETQWELRTMVDSLEYIIHSEIQSNVFAAIKLGTSLTNVLSKTVVHLLKKFTKKTIACNGKIS